MNKLIKTLADDTLKREKDGIRRFSKTALTMFVAFVLVCGTYIYDLITHGFRMETFLVMVGIALGTKTTDALSKKLNKTNNSQ